MRTVITYAITLSLLYGPTTSLAQEIKADSPQYLAKSISETAVEISNAQDNEAAKQYLEKLVPRKNQKGKEGYSTKSYTSEELQTIRCGEEKSFSSGSVTYCYANKGKTMNFMMLFASKGLDKSIPGKEDITILFHDEDANSITQEDFIRTVKYDSSRRLGSTLTNKDGVRFNWDITDCAGNNHFLNSNPYILADTVLFFREGKVHSEALKKYAARLGKSSSSPDLSETVRATITRTIQELNSNSQKYTSGLSQSNCVQ